MHGFPTGASTCRPVFRFSLLRPTHNSCGHATFSTPAVPTVCLATYADFRIKDIASINDAGGVVSMKVGGWLATS